MLMIAGQLLLLISACGVSLVLLQQHKQDQEQAWHGLVKVFAVSSLFIAAAALAGLTLRSDGMDQQALLRMTENLAYYVALPFLASVLLARGRLWFWSMAAWGRWLLGLIAFFELARRTEYGVAYTQFLAIGVPLTLAAASLFLSNLQARGLGLVGSVTLAISLVFFGPEPLLGSGTRDGFAFGLSLSLPPLALALHLSLRTLVKEGQA
ncbi:hypothetical protein [Nitrincola tapanii]|uniref:Uncharacterized protein n=1 Tax=Nitrincola tapanii TaxID=1708751 RepID=A0A5A9VZJ1_9GAMM|nr:hypothetical protein [Nitrincola tapanii]KAA0873654.1 hypothetical protein E1H14_12200 [Nitrincola tapanii]